MPDPGPLTRALAAARTVSITAPVPLDGDAVGAMAGLARAIGARWPGHAVRLVAGEPLPSRYDFLAAGVPPFDRAEPGASGPAADLAIVVDGGPARIGGAEAAWRAARVRAQIDHHQGGAAPGIDAAFIDAEAASTTELVLALCDHWGVPLDPTLATALYTGMLYDTGGFRYQLTRPATLRGAARLIETGFDFARIVERVLLDQPPAKQRLRGQLLARVRVEADGRIAWAALGAGEVDGIETGGLIDDLIFTEGVEAAALLVERPGGRVKVSLRSRGGLDCSRVAHGLDAEGGGHVRAGGVTLAGSVETVAARVREALVAALARGPGGNTRAGTAK